MLSSTRPALEMPHIACPPLPPRRTAEKINAGVRSVQHGGRAAAGQLPGADVLLLSH